LERLAEGPIIGDGGFVFALERRGYVKAGPWTPEAAVENPDAGKTQIHFETIQFLMTVISY
jgi:betaine-homocysteine S-methyltransferase